MRLNIDRPALVPRRYWATVLAEQSVEPLVNLMHNWAAFIMPHHLPDNTPELPSPQPPTSSGPAPARRPAAAHRKAGWVAASILGFVACWVGLTPTTAAELLLERFDWDGPVPQNGGWGMAIVDDGAAAAAPSDAMITVDLEVDGFLQRAKALAGQEDYPRAIQILQHLLDEPVRGRDWLTDVDGRGVTYRPVREAAEAMLLSLPVEGVRAYRLTVDADASVLMNRWQRQGDLSALRKVATHYFASSQGQSAAYALGGVGLDQYDFSGASYWLTRAATYRQGTMPVAPILARLAVARARLGDVKAAEALLTELQKPEHAGITPSVLAVLKQELDRAVSGALAGGGTPETNTGGDDYWPMRLGGPGRDGMAPQPLTGLAGDRASWVTQWQAALPRFDRNTLNAYGVNDGDRREQPRSELLERWLKGGWSPTQHLVVGQGRLYSKEPGRIVCRDAATGQLIWEAAEGTPTAPETNINIQLRRYGNQGLLSTEPAVMTEMWHFREMLSKGLTLQDDVVYAIDPQGLMPWIWTSVMTGNSWVATVQGKIAGGYGNRLAAYSATDGRLLWRTPAGYEEVGALSRIRFVSEPTPVGAGGRNIVAAIEGLTGELLLISLDSQSGELLWQTTLVSDQGQHTSGWSPVGVAAVGSEVYIASGRGVVFAVDGETGSLRWATRYRRDIPQVMATNRFGGQGATPNAQGFERDTIIPVGNLLVIMPSDARALLAIDRTNGRPVYQLPQQGMDYCVGTWRDPQTRSTRVILAGTEQLRCYDITSAKLMWQTSASESYGRGIVTRAGVMYMPGRQSINRYAAADGRNLGPLNMRTDPEMPVGSLAADGQRLYIMDIDGLAAWQDAESHLVALAQRATAGDSLAFLERARLNRRLGNEQAALTDLRQALEMTLPDTHRESTRKELVAGLLALAHAPTTTAAKRGELLREAARWAGDNHEQARVKLASAKADAEAGKIQEAIATLAELAVMEPAGQVNNSGAESGSGPGQGSGSVLVVVEDSGPGTLRADVATLAASLLRELVTKHGQAARTLLDQHGQAALAAAAGDALALWRVVAAHPDTPAATDAARAALAAQATAAQRSNFEQNEARLRLLERWSDPATAAQAKAMHEALFAQAAARLSEGVIPASESAPWSTPAPPWEPAWSMVVSGARMVNVSAGKTEAEAGALLGQYVLVYSPAENRLELRRAADGSIHWAAPLPADRTGFEELNSGDRFLSELLLPGGSLPGQGHMAVMRKDGLIAGLGLVSGRRIWEMAMEGETTGTLRRVINDPQYLAHRLEQLSVGEGVAAMIIPPGNDSASGAGGVGVVDVIDGRLLWTRRFADEPVQGVVVAAGYVNILFQGGQRMVICDVRTGRIAGELTLEDYVVGAGIVWTSRGPLVRNNDHWMLHRLPDGRPVLGGASTRGAVAAGLLDESTLFFATADRTLRLMDMATGKLTKAWSLESETPGQIVDVARSADGAAILVHLDALAAMGLTLDPRVSTLPMQLRQQELVRRRGGDRDPNAMPETILLLDSATGGQLLQLRHQATAYQPRTDLKLYARHGDLLPWVVWGKERKTRLFQNNLDLTLYRRTSGEEVPVTILGLAEGQLKPQLSGPPVVIHGTVILTTTAGLEAYRGEAATPAP